MGREGKVVGELCVESRLCYGDWIEGGNGREGSGGIVC